MKRETKMTLLKYLLEKSAKDWNMSLRFALMLVLAPLVGSVLVAASRLDYGLYHFLTAEDGPIEWLTVICFAGACIFGVRIALHCFRTQRRGLGLVYLLFALGMCFAAGEEISWGQRLFNLQTPELLEQINKQDELNIHNIGDTLRILNLIQLVMGGVGCTIYFLNELFDLSGMLRIESTVFVVPFFLSSWYLVVFAFRLARLLIWQDSGFTITKYGEWAEFCLAFGLVSFTALITRRFSANTPAAAPYPLKRRRG